MHPQEEALVSCGPAAGAAVHSLLQSPSPESPPEAVAAATEGIKAFAAALSVAEGDSAKIVVMLLLLPLLIGAAAPASGRPAPALQARQKRDIRSLVFWDAHASISGKAPEGLRSLPFLRCPPLQTLAVTLITRLAGAAPEPFKAAVGGAACCSVMDVARLICASESAESPDAALCAPSEQAQRMLISCCVRVSAGLGADSKARLQAALRSSAAAPAAQAPARAPGAPPAIQLKAFGTAA